MFSSVEEGFSYIEGFTNFEKKGFNLRFFRLDRMNRLLEMFGNPESSFRTYHVAGSKGKGSTATFLASVLREAGYTTGLYTSPHLVSYKERITLAGDEIEDKLFLDGIEALRVRMTDSRPGDFPGGEFPTTFELLTCLGFMIFRSLGCDFAVLETGMGGRLDATNVVVPEASILTPIELEHTEYLGETIEAISGEKAGIIKKGIPVFCSPQPAEAFQVFENHAREAGSRFFYLPECMDTLRCHTTRTGTDLNVTWKPVPTGESGPRGAGRSPDPLSIKLRLLGEVQAENAALAALTLWKTRPEIGTPTIIRGLETAYIPGRFQRLTEDPPVYVDGSHTPLSVTRLLHSLREIHPSPRTLILGIVGGKRYEEMARILCPAFREVIVTTPGTFKPSEPEKLLACCLKFNPNSRFIPLPAEALRAAMAGVNSFGGEIMITGSFYLAGEILKTFGDSVLEYPKTGGMVL